MKRTQKAKILSELLSGKPAMLLHMHQHRERDPAKMSTLEIKAEYERLRKQQFEQTGVMPPPLPDFAAMPLDELHAYRDQKGFNYDKPY